MTRTPNPATCDFCMSKINPDDQSYSIEVEVKREWKSNKRAKGKNADMCHACFIKMGECGYKPEWKHEYLNPNYVAGSKKAEEKYWLPLNVGTTEATTQEKIAA